MWASNGPMMMTGGIRCVWNLKEDRLIIEAPELTKYFPWSRPSCICLERVKSNLCSIVLRTDVLKLTEHCSMGVSSGIVSLCREQRPMFPRPPTPTLAPLKICLTCSSGLSSVVSFHPELSVCVEPVEVWLLEQESSPPRMPRRVDTRQGGLSKVVPVDRKTVVPTVAPWPGIGRRRC
ncbi:A Disintegrin And Metalloproteinase With Thrombospondin Motifs 2 [Manis pentadactyla]|nr:A Disintegrin And Metalloproteinase With Thrombospondin Motifs 2 [Manis pentadactyla]